VLRGDAVAGLHYYRRSLEIYELLADLFGQANVHNNIAIVHRRDGRYADALEANSRALVLRERLHDPWGIAMSRNNLAQIRRAQGDVEQAEIDYRAALDLWASIGYVSGVAIARTGLGIALVERGEYVVGTEHLEQALEQWTVLGSRTYVSETKRYLAQACLVSDPSAAVAWAEQAVATAREVRAADQEGVALQVLGKAQVARRELQLAIDALEQSREILRGTTERQELARTLAALADAYLSLAPSDGRRQSSLSLIAEARAIFAELGARLDLARLDSAARSSGENVASPHV
jgi:tetratricopeptide (TPR) repeat protein